MRPHQNFATLTFWHCRSSVRVHRSDCQHLHCSVVRGELTVNFELSRVSHLHDRAYPMERDPREPMARTFWQGHAPEHPCRGWPRSVPRYGHCTLVVMSESSKMRGRRGGHRADGDDERSARGSREKPPPDSAGPLRVLRRYLPLASESASQGVRHFRQVGPSFVLLRPILARCYRRTRGKEGSHQDGRKVAFDGKTWYRALLCPLIRRAG